MRERRSINWIARGTPADYMRVRGFPFSEVVETFLAEHEFCFVVEQNRDAQHFSSLLTLETSVAKEKAEERFGLRRISLSKPPRGCKGF